MTPERHGVAVLLESAGRGVPTSLLVHGTLAQTYHWGLAGAMCREVLS